MRFNQYLTERKRVPLWTVASEFNTKDTYPAMSADGKCYVFYHGTTRANAKSIMAGKTIKGSPGWGSGVATTHHDASIYGTMKSMETKSKSVTLEIEIYKDWLDRQEFTREIGGHGINQFLVRGDIPPEAIRSIKIAKTPRGKYQ